MIDSGTNSEDSTVPQMLQWHSSLEFVLKTEGVRRAQRGHSSLMRELWGEMRVRAVETQTSSGKRGVEESTRSLSLPALIHELVDLGARMPEFNTESTGLALKKVDMSTERNEYTVCESRERGDCSI